MAKSLRNELPNEKETDFVFDAGITVTAGGLYRDVSSFVPILTFLSGPALGREIPLVHKQLTIGRGSDCDILIPDPSVSRKHVRIFCREIIKSGEKPKLKVVVRDLGSRNGTLVNYRAVHQAVLKPGDKLFLGRVILKFDHRDIAEQGFYDEIYRLATTDSLTSLLNKAAITRFLSEEIVGLARKKSWVGAVLADVDGFKGINDRLGHLTGDRVLQSAARMFRNNIRRRDRIGRFGGDEFLIVLPETGPKGARLLAERMRKALETAIAAELGLAVSITASFGTASARAGSADCDSLVEKADRALYRAKALGRNRTEVYKAYEFEAGR
jgi:diguanylate cyclase (GGDEF)-like protein